MWTEYGHLLEVVYISTKHLYNIFTMLDQRRRRLADVVQMLCKCFVFAGISPPVTQTIEKIIGDRSMRKHTKILIMRQRIVNISSLKIN